MNRICCWLLALMLGSQAALAFDNGINDLHGGTPAPPGSSGGPPGGGPGPDGGPGSGDPVALFSGQYFLNTTDFEIPGRMPLRVRRFYRSGSSYQGMFGRGWNMEFNERVLVVSTNGNLVLRRNGTARDEFTRTAPDVFTGAGGFETLTRNSDATYTLKNRYGSRREYNVEGALVEVSDRHGNQLKLSYVDGGRLPINAVSDHSHLTNPILVARDLRLRRMEVAYSNQLSGRFIEFTYDNDGRVTRATDFTGRAWEYAYDPAGQGKLLTVTTPAVAGSPAGLTSRYSYTTNGHWMETVTDRSGNTLLTNRYDTAGRVTFQRWGSATWSFGYPNATDRWETNGNGHRIHRIFDATGVMKERREYTAGLVPGEPAYHRLRFDSVNGQQGSKTIHPSGNVTVYRYDAAGNLTETRLKAADTADSGSDVVTRMIHEPVYNQIKSQIGPRGEETIHHYDHEDPTHPAPRGDLVRIQYPEVDGVRPEVRYVHDRFGQVERVTNEDGMVTVMERDAATGYLLSRIEGYGTGLAATNRYTYDARGNVLRSTDPRGNTTTQVYDALDRLVEVTGPAPFSRVTRFVHTGNGKPARIERQTGDVLRPWQVTEFTYDVLDRLVRRTDDLGQSTEFRYDGNGNTAAVVDANGNTSTMVYDERNLLHRFTDALTNTVTFAYTSNGLPLLRRDARGNASTNVYDALDRVVALVRPDGAPEQFLRDTAGNTVARRTMGGRWSTNEIDSLGRLSAVRHEDGGATEFSHDAAGRILRVVSTNGTWSFGYDVMGRRMAATNSHGRVTRHAYDRAGNLSQLTYPDGTFLAYAYDSLNRLTNISYQGSRLVAALAYDGLGRRSMVTYGNGTRAQYTYDSADRMLGVVHQPVAGGADLVRFTRTFDAVGNPLTQTVAGGNAPGESRFEYDRAHQLTGVQYPGGSPFAATTVQYDAAGNRVRVTAGAATDYVANNRNQYASVGGQAWFYNANGALTGDAVWSFDHDADDQLGEVRGPGVTARYEYDPFRRRISKDVNGAVRQFVYNEVGDFPMLLMESGAEGAPLAKYVIYGMSPLAMIVGDSIFSLHCDALERPVMATDPGGAVAWRGTFSAFGEGSVAAGAQIQQPLRAPGQYDDSETGLQYNMARYHDPKRGRFLTEDPAVEAASPLFAQVQERNAYAYVRNNAMTGVDPNGQSVFFIVCSAGIPVCSAALFCSLNAGACSGGVICSANIGACSAALACSGNAGAACSASVMACSASVAAACSGNAGGVCSGAVFCSAQVGSGVGACSGSILACSAQAGVYGASACSGNLAGGCSAQASVVGGSACSAQLAGVCSVQVGAGGAACSAQAAGACSGQAGPGVSLCSSQLGGACSAQWGPGHSGCSAQAQGCSGDASCKQAFLPSGSGPDPATLALAQPPTLGGWRVERGPDDRYVVRFVARGAASYLLSSGVGKDPGRELSRGGIQDGTLVELSGVSPGPGEPPLRLVLKSEGGQTLEIGPIAIPEGASGTMVAGTPKRSTLASMVRGYGVFLLSPFLAP